jgi:hypothetical protein
MSYKSIFLILSPLIIFVFYSNCGSRAEPPVYSYIPLSTLPSEELNSNQRERIIYDCADFNYEGSENIDASKGCTLFSMKPIVNNQAVYVDYKDFSEQDLITKISLFFPDFEKAPVIILEGDGVLEEGLNNPGFDIVIR